MMIATQFVLRRFKPLLCQVAQERSLFPTCRFHKAVPLFVVRLGKSKKKIIKPLRITTKLKKELVTIQKDMTVQDLAKVLNRDTDKIFDVLDYINYHIKRKLPETVIKDIEVIKEVIKLSGFRYKVHEQSNAPKVVDKDVYPRPPAKAEELVRRPPVVTIMGHVDHGKTTLLDALRHSNMVSQEFGGITQHIGAFTVNLDTGEDITFLDTPGHAAFHAMRARGAHVTDIVVLVVAADDGVMKQTKESIKHAQDAKVPIIVAINKIDKPESDIEATKTMLLQNGLYIEDYGGDIQVVPVSALKGLHLDDLQEAIVALSEIQDVKADPSGKVEGVVIESRTDPHRGKLSTALIQRGTLMRGTYLVAGEAFAKVRAMFNDKGKPIHKAPPGTAVEVLGWRELPHAGNQILEVNNEKHVHEVIQYRSHLRMSKKADQDMAVYNTMMEAHKKEYVELRDAMRTKYRRTAVYRKMQRQEEIVSHTEPELAIVIKGDVDGSVEAILDTLESYHSNKCRLHIVSYGVGEVSSHDVNMASSFNGIIYAFNTSWKDDVKKLAYKEGVTLKQYNVIYKMLDDLREELQEKLPKLQEEEILGEAEVLKLFKIKERKDQINVVGCRCVKGSLQKKHHFHLIRDGEIILTDNLESMKHLKSEVETVKTDVECGLSFRDQTIEPIPGDQIVCFTFKEVEQTLDWELDF